MIMIEVPSVDDSDSIVSVSLLAKWSSVSLMTMETVESVLATPVLCDVPCDFEPPVYPDKFSDNFVPEWEDSRSSPKCRR